MEQKWNALYKESYETVVSALPVKDKAYANVQGAAYWQWAGASLTDKYLKSDSIVNVKRGAYAGFPEYSYFIAKHFLPNSSVNNIENLDGIDF